MWRRRWAPDFAHRQGLLALRTARASPVTKSQGLKRRTVAFFSGPFESFHPHRHIWQCSTGTFSYVAEKVGFEPTDAFTSPVFKTGSLNPSDTSPSARHSFESAFIL